MGSALQLLLCRTGLPAAEDAGGGAFPGTEIYAGLVVVLVTTMIHGLKPARVCRIGKHCRLTGAH
jgi:hypothetical protein